MLIVHEHCHAGDLGQLHVRILSYAAGVDTLLAIAGTQPTPWLYGDKLRMIGVKLVSGVYEEEIDTLGGLIFMLAGHVPVRGEVVTDDSGVQFEVVDADARRIKRVRLRLPDMPATGSTL